MKKAVLYVHGRGGDPGEAAHYRPLFPDCAVIGAAYTGDTPWDAAPELLACYDEAEGRYGSVILIANSIGAYFSMNALRDRRPRSQLPLCALRCGRRTAARCLKAGQGRQRHRGKGRRAGRSSLRPWEGAD